MTDINCILCCTNPLNKLLVSRIAALNLDSKTFYMRTKSALK